MKWSKAILLAVIGIFIGCACGSIRFYPTYAHDVDRIQYESAVRIRVLCVDTQVNPDGTKEFVGRPIGGSGVAVDGTHVVTARHVIACQDMGEAKMIIVTTRDGTARVMAIDAVSPTVDVARLTLLPGQPHFKMWALVSNRKPRIGETVCIVAGDVPGLHSIRKCGDVADHDDGTILVGMHGVPGNSGSALFDEHGNVLGILSMGQWESHREFVVLFVPSAAWGQLQVPNPFKNVFAVRP